MLIVVHPCEVLPLSCRCRFSIHHWLHPGTAATTPVDGLGHPGFDDHPPAHDEVGDIAGHRDTAIDDLERNISIDRYAAPPKLDRQGVGIHRFEESGAQHVVELEPAPMIRFVRSL